MITAFPTAQGPSRDLIEGGTCLSMLPGFRFLFAAIVLSMSILVFGLGAAALLRAAHEAFASNPSWHMAPETTFAQQGEATKPALAMLRVEPQPAEQKPAAENAAEQRPADQKPADDFPESAAPAETPVTVPAPEQTATVSAPAEPERIAALKPDDSSPPEIAKSEIAKPENSKPEILATEIPAQSETAPAQSATAPAPADETKMAATEQAVPPANDASPAAAEQIGAPASPEADGAPSKIATLGGPPVTVETPPPAKVDNAKPDESAIKKRLQARRAAQRRKIAARARVAARQLPANPFAQPFPQPPAAARSR
jgi:hypothetical protein